MPGKSIQSIFDSFKDLKVLIVGDVMLDTYIWGKADRISPEAPVPVVKTSNTEHRLGGAANVALNIRAMGATPKLCSVVGEDTGGRRLIDSLKASDIESGGIIRSNSRPTTVKTRVLSGYQHIVRIDAEKEDPLSHEEELELLEAVMTSLKDADAVIFEDYDKGTLTPSVIATIIEKSNELDIPTVVDPKRKNFMTYHGARIFKPNLKELADGLKLQHEPETIEEISKAVEELQQKVMVQEVFLTLSEKGMLVKNEESQVHIPAHIRTISDVSGAGDTVISLIALCKALDLNSSFTAELANLGGGLVCEHVGVVPIDKDALYREAEKYDIVRRL